MLLSDSAIEYFWDIFTILNLQTMVLKPVYMKVGFRYIYKYKLIDIEVEFIKSLS